MKKQLFSYLILLNMFVIILYFVWKTKVEENDSKAFMLLKDERYVYGLARIYQSERKKRFGKDS